MQYWRINTDASARGDVRTCDLWYSYGMVFTGDLESTKFAHAVVMRKLLPGDGVFMHHSGLGLVGYGIVQSRWDGRIVTGADRRLYVNEEIEYCVPVAWDPTCDCRHQPVPVRGLLPHMGTSSFVDQSRWNVSAVLRLLQAGAVGMKGRGAMQENDGLQFDAPLEDDREEVDVPASRRRVYTELGDPEIESLHGKFKRGKLIVQPDFQRQFVWDVTRSSRLIESALLGIPIPVVYISQEADNREYVIDGQQRLTAFFSFIDGAFPNQTVFKLSGLKVFKELNGKQYRDLSEAHQDVVRYFKLRTITFKPESDQDLKFEIFERLNTGSVSLNDQELRNCIYRGPFNKLLRTLSVESDFTWLLGLERPDKRMKDIELALRFSAFYHATYLNYKPPMKSFLNHEAEGRSTN